jgi:hypothetical protein
MTVEQVIADALVQADRLFEDRLREVTTKLLGSGGPNAEPDPHVIDDELARCRDAWALERAKVHGIIQKALGVREKVEAVQQPGC